MHFETMLPKTEWVLMELELIDVEKQFVFLNLPLCRNERGASEMMVCTTDVREAHLFLIPQPHIYILVNFIFKLLVFNPKKR